MSPAATAAPCFFCNVIKGKGSVFKLFESEKTLAFLDISPLSRGHSLIIPKYHGVKLHDIPDEHLSELLSVTKKIAVAQGLVDYNILQNNGKSAHQFVDHVHFHLIPKPNEKEGLGVQWPAKEVSETKVGAEWRTEEERDGELQKLLEEIKAKM